ncbi:hypothetical protein PFISCL1PPCAC_4152, partial [Pristionchus fissidentatus]
LYPDMSRCSNMVVIGDTAFCYTARLWALDMPEKRWRIVEVHGDTPLHPRSTLERHLRVSSDGLLEVAGVNDSIQCAYSYYYRVDASLDPG